MVLRAFLLLFGALSCHAQDAPQLDSIAIGVSGNRTEDIYEADFEDEATGIQIIVTTVESHSTCHFTTPDGLITEEIHCDINNLQACTETYTFPERPAGWSYKVIIDGDIDRTCGIEFSEIALADSGEWNIVLANDNGAPLTINFNLNILGNSITGVSEPSGQIVPAGEAGMIAIARTPITTCRFEHDGLSLDLTPGSPEVMNKPAGDTVRPDDWKYSWLGWNSSELNCGIMLQYVHQADEGEWKVTTYKEGKPEMTQVFNLDVTDFAVVEEPLSTSNTTITEGESASMIYRMSYPYHHCTFTTSDGKVLEPLRCDKEGDLNDCVKKHSPSADDAARVKAGWTYQYQAYDDTDLECGIQINMVAQADVGTWSVEIESLTGEITTAEFEINELKGMELIVEDYNAVATAGQSLEMVFRTDLAYDDCQFVTPQGFSLNLTNGLPTQFPWLFDDSRTDDWMYSWFGYNSSSRDCGIKIQAAEMADVGVWTVNIMRNTGSSISHTFEVKEGSSSAAPTGGSSAAPTGGSSAAPTGGSSAAPTGGSSAAPTGGSSTAPSTSAPPEVTTSSSATSQLSVILAILLITFLLGATDNFKP